MKRIAKFHKVSWEQFRDAMQDAHPKFLEAEIRNMYDILAMPKRATQKSAGYDFFAPFGFSLEPGESIKVPTGMRVEIQDNWMFGIYPRSGLGFKYRLQLDNTVGIIDADYFDSDNEGHIMIKVTNDSKQKKTLSVNLGMAFAQGIFSEYGITMDDDTDGIRNGGFGSTTRD